MSVEINQLHFTYQNSNFGLQIPALSLDKGLTAIVGQNGAGKSTFFKLLMGLLPLQDGNISINGKGSHELTGRARLTEIGILFQNPDDQLFNATVKKEVTWSARQITRDRAQVDQIVESALTKVELLDKADENPFDLSLSDRKLLAFATLLATNPQTYLMDEPMIALDWHSQTIVLHILKQLADEGRQIIVSTHDMDLVAHSFPRVITFDHGAMVFDGTPTALFGSPAILAQAGLLPPRIMQLCALLGDTNVYLTTEDYVSKHQA
ncbi:energy-coupling factor ABC transporter ATP-binding protein [Lacticaseibacillus hulanensis]|uniref:energy-coupling factor ABC transporter ATP-binding protein n=1 Tax=Lacticaseibacillus hulanensis TaxID=2493111 RepID=UPI000FDCA2EA|nr:ABC transporter ATP-binding protein [Lacticaseibacillus hulanensis]